MEKSSAHFIDSNIFIFSVLNEGILGEKCREILGKIHKWELNGISSCLVFDEVLWAIRKYKPDKYVDICKDILDINIKFVDINKPIIYNSLEYIKKYNLRPRDAIHVATMIINNCSIIVSEDGDFDRVEEIKRVDIVSSFLAKNFDEKDLEEKKEEKE